MDITGNCIRQAMKLPGGKDSKSTHCRSPDSFGSKPIRVNCRLRREQQNNLTSTKLKLTANGDREASCRKPATRRVAQAHAPKLVSAHETQRHPSRPHSANCNRSLGTRHTGPCKEPLARITGRELILRSNLLRGLSLCFGASAGPWQSKAGY